MSRTTAPLLSFGASGQIAKTMVASAWKGITYMRKYVVPANPKTAAQMAQRALVTAVVSGWKNYYTSAVARAAWNRSATNATKAMSGFNFYASQALKVAATDPASSFSNGVVAGAGNIATWTVLNLDDGIAGDEAGDFEIWKGLTVSGMVLFESVAIVAGEVISTDLGETDDVLFVKIRKGGYDRSGIAQITLVV